MFLEKIRLKSIAAAVITAFGLSLTPVVPVSAALVDNERLVSEQQAMNDRAFVKTFMERDDVRTEFEALGVDAAEAQARVDALSDAEVAQLAEEIRSTPAGQGVLTALIGAGVLIFLVLLITDMLGFTSVFGFTNKGAANPS
ncbi:MAG: PA2779 family protein [Rhodospirillales bacterium]|nr:PA2779 family protein [Rhodospirillales bacterium]MBO6787818.1 PA2779 family protein [Rhodospirillales bacterium]